MLETVYQTILLITFIFALSLRLIKIENHNYDLLVFIGILMDIVIPIMAPKYSWLIKYHFILIHTYMLFFIIYVYHLYQKEFIHSIIASYHQIIFLITCVLYIFFFFIGFREFKYSQSLIFSSSVYILCATLLYFIYLIIQKQVIYIFHEFIFWFSLSSLLWSLFFILKMTLIYFFYENNKDFFFATKSFFTMINIVAYLLIIKGLSCLHRKK